jgi:hypothetical protein
MQTFLTVFVIVKYNTVYINANISMHIEQETATRAIRYGRQRDLAG